MSLRRIQLWILSRIRASYYSFRNSLQIQKLTIIIRKRLCPRPTKPHPSSINLSSSNRQSLSRNNPMRTTSSNRLWTTLCRHLRRIIMELSTRKSRPFRRKPQGVLLPLSSKFIGEITRKFKLSKAHSLSFISNHSNNNIIRHRVTAPLGRWGSARLWRSLSAIQ